MRSDAGVAELRSDPAVHNLKGVYEFLLGGEKQTQLLNVRLFDAKTTQQAYLQQKSKAEAAGKSNCSLCAVGHSANATKIWAPKEMEADHVSAWSKGGGIRIGGMSRRCCLLAGGVNARGGPPGELAFCYSPDVCSRQS